MEELKAAGQMEGAVAKTRVNADPERGRRASVELSHYEVSDDDTNDILNMVEIVDSSGCSHQPAWQKGWTRLADGIETRRRAT